MFLMDVTWQWANYFFITTTINTTINFFHSFVFMPRTKGLVPLHNKRVLVLVDDVLETILSTLKSTVVPSHGILLCDYVNFDFTAEFTSSCTTSFFFVVCIFILTVNVTSKMWLVGTPNRIYVYICYIYVFFVCFFWCDCGIVLVSFDNKYNSP